MNFKFIVFVSTILFSGYVKSEYHPHVDPCYRKCKHGEPPQTCTSVWVLEHYQSMGPACGDCSKGNILDCFNPMCVTVDGVERGVLSNNRKIPGPPIQVCKNDILIIDIVNKMEGSAASFHWHGFKLKNYTHMDGVPYVTQCPIPFGTTFRYTFPANDSGTFFYHSHAGHHKSDGLYGAIIVREPEEDDPNSSQYDHDSPYHLIVAADWTHDSTDMWIKGLSTRKPGVNPTNLLINGKGKFWTNTETSTSTLSPIEVFQVKKGGRYRFRLINSASHMCLLKLQIQNHRMLVIATDNNPVQPRYVDTIYFGSGERFDFVLEANQTEGNYWMRLHGSGACEKRNLNQYALLTYSDTDPRNLSVTFLPKFGDEDPFPNGVVLNNPNTTCYNNLLQDSGPFCTADLQSYNFHSQSENDTENIYKRIVMGFSEHRVSNKFIYSQYEDYMTAIRDINVMGEIGNISLSFPSFPLLSQRDEIKYGKNGTLCNINNLPDECTTEELCICTHVEKVPLNSVVEFVLFEKTSQIGQLNHPWHLHGNEVNLIGMGQFPGNMTLSEIQYHVHNDPHFLKTQPIGHKPPLKDTISIPSRGYVVLQLRANNPGFWIFHCHFEWHLGTGMGFILQVGEFDEMDKTPKTFPKCGNYLDSHM